MGAAEDRRDETVAAIIAAGGSVLSVEPLARDTAPHVIVRYRVTAGASDPAVLAALAEVREETEVHLSGLVPWTEEEVPDA